MESQANSNFSTLLAKEPARLCQFSVPLPLRFLSELTRCAVINICLTVGAGVARPACTSVAAKCVGACAPVSTRVLVTLINVFVTSLPYRSKEFFLQFLFSSAISVPQFLMVVQTAYIILLDLIYCLI